MLFHICRAVAYDGVTDRMGLVEGIAGKGDNLIVDAVRHCFGNPVGYGSRNGSGGVSVHKGDTLRVDHGMLFLGDRTADDIGLPQ